MATNWPSYEELWERVQVADEVLCDALSGQDRGSEGAEGLERRLAIDVLGVLRTGKNQDDYDAAVYCPECGHINGLGHSCAMWDGNHESTGLGFWSPGQANGNIPPSATTGSPLTRLVTPEGTTDGK